MTAGVSRSRSLPFSARAGEAKAIAIRAMQIVRSHAMSLATKQCTDVTFDIRISTDGHRGSVRPGDDRTRSWTCLQEGSGALFAGDVDRDRKRVCRSRPRTDHRDVGELVGACSGVRIENVMETPGLLEGRAIAPRH